MSFGDEVPIPVALDDDDEQDDLGTPVPGDTGIINSGVKVPKLGVRNTLLDVSTFVPNHLPAFLTPSYKTGASAIAGSAGAAGLQYLMRVPRAQAAQHQRDQLIRNFGLITFASSRLGTSFVEDTGTLFWEDQVPSTEQVINRTTTAASNALEAATNRTVTAATAAATAASDLADRKMKDAEAAMRRVAEVGTGAATEANRKLGEGIDAVKAGVAQASGSISAAAGTAQEKISGIDTETITYVLLVVAGVYVAYRVTRAE